MTQSHLFVIDPLASLNPKLDSSLRMMHALAGRGHKIFVCEPFELSWRRGEALARARCQELTFGPDAVTYQAAPRHERSLGEFAAVHNRKDPPYDMDYVQTTWLLGGAAVGPRHYNDPSALRLFNEKLAILHFPQDCHEALASADPKELMGFIGEVGGDVVIKPLTLFGGRGVERLQLATMGTDAVMAKLVAETGNGIHMRLVQPFDQAIFAGEVRVFTAFGEPLAWCLKKPAEGNFLANTRAGAVLSAYTPTAVETERVTRVAKTMLKQGVALIGFDLIGGYVSELNITSPRLLQADGTTGQPYARFAELVEADLGSFGKL